MDKIAQQKLIDQLTREEQELQFPFFNHDTALSLGMLYIAEAQNKKLPVMINIQMNGQLLFHCALPGTAIINEYWVNRKVKVVNTFAHSSYFMGSTFALHGITIQQAALLDPSEYGPYGGAFPIWIKQSGMVGCITISGLSQEEDHQFLVDGLRKFLAKAF